MGRTPTSYPLTSEHLAGLDGIDYPFSSSDLLGLTDYVPMGTPTLNRTSSTKKSAHLSSSFTQTSDTFVCGQPSGGTGNFSYTWQQVSGTTLTVNSPNSASTTFSRNALGVITTSVYCCRVTDGVSTVYSGNVTITFKHFDVFEAYISSLSTMRYDPNDVTVSVILGRDGRVYHQSNGGSLIDKGAWVAPASATVGDDFEMLWDNDNTVSGDNASVSPYSSPTSSGTVATINTNRKVVCRRTTIGSSKAGFRIRARCKGQSGWPLDKSGLFVQATVTSPPVGMGMGIGMGGIGMGIQLP